MQERRVDVLGAVAHPVERGHQQHQEDESADDRGIQEHIAQSGAARAHPLLEASTTSDQRNPDRMISEINAVTMLRANSQRHDSPAQSSTNKLDSEASR